MNYVEEKLDELRKERGENEAITYATEFAGRKFALIPLTLLHIDETYQRTENFSIKRVHKIVDEWDHDREGVITVFFRNNKYFVSDGMHRVMAHILREDYFIVASIGKDLGYQHEVETFRDQEVNARRPSAYDRLKANAAIGDPLANDVFNTCKANGFTISPKKKASESKMLCCSSLITKIVQIYGKEHLDDILEVLLESNWANDTLGLSRIFISVISYGIRTISNIIRKSDTHRLFCEENYIGFCLPALLKQISPRRFEAEALVLYPDYQMEKAMNNLIKDIVIILLDENYSCIEDYLDEIRERRKGVLEK